MKTYKCHTKNNWWTFEANDDLDAVRLALYYCWRDGETFKSVETWSGNSILLCIIDNNIIKAI